MVDHSRARRSPACPTAAALMAGPERLVALGFRYWMLGCQRGDIHAWETAFRVYSGKLGTREARLAISGLSSWVTCVNASARREICVAGVGHRQFCRDECLAVTMVAACQHDDCPALKACAFSLIEASLIDEVMTETESFATILRSLRQMLSPACIALATELARMPQYNHLH